MIDFQAALALDLTLEPVAAEQVVSGSPRTGSAALGVFNGQEFGVWEMSAGSMSDVEVEELFVVVDGRATVVFASGDSVEIEPGTVGRLSDGDRTVWHVADRIRKVYVTSS